MTNVFVRNNHLTLSIRIWWCEVNVTSGCVSLLPLLRCPAPLGVTVTEGVGAGPEYGWGVSLNIGSGVGAGG